MTYLFFNPFFLCKSIAHKPIFATNRPVHLVGSEGKEKVKYSTTPIVWPKSRDGLFFVEIAFNNVQENVPELFLQRNQSNYYDSDDEGENEGEEEVEESEEGEDDIEN